MESGSERRRSERVQKVSLLQAQSFLIGNSVNLSLHGALAELHEPLKDDIPVRLDLSVGDSVLEIQARVVYVHFISGGRYQIGLDFQALSPDQLEALGRFLKTPGKTPPAK